jgi:uncharacterized membrane protein YGL010W
MNHKLRRLDAIQFYIQLLTAVLFMYKVIEAPSFSIVGFSIAILLLVGWVVGFIRHRIIRRRLRKNGYSRKSKTV